MNLYEIFQDAENKQRAQMFRKCSQNINFTVANFYSFGLIAKSVSESLYKFGVA